MPNWCGNMMIVRSSEPKRLEEFDNAFKGKGTKWGVASWQLDGKTPEEVAEIKAKYEKDYEELEPTYSFDALYPVPQEVIDVGFSGNRQGVSLERSLEALRDKEKWIDGYTWCVSHWGTKWDIDGETVGVGKDDNEYTYHFSTAWSPPEGWLAKVAKDWTDLSFELRYEEGGNCFAGYLLFEDGELVEDVEVTGDDYRQFVIDNFGYDPYGDMEDWDE